MNKSEAIKAVKKASKVLIYFSLTEHDSHVIEVSKKHAIALIRQQDNDVDIECNTFQNKLSSTTTTILGN